MRVDDTVAFRDVEGQCSIPIVKDGYDFQFTRNWFRNRNQATWSTFLKPHYRGLKMEWPIRMLQIGVFEGADLVWCLQNFLGHPDSRVIAVDPWAETTKLDSAYMAAVEQRARHNLSYWQDKVQIIKGYSAQVLQELCNDPANLNSFDLIVIDGDHTRAAVVTDAVYSLELAKPKGWLVFDDVRNRIPKPDHVIHGIEEFLCDCGDRVKFKWAHRYCDCYEKI